MMMTMQHVVTARPPLPRAARAAAPPRLLILAKGKGGEGLLGSNHGGTEKAAAKGRREKRRRRTALTDAAQDGPVMLGMADIAFGNPPWQVDKQAPVNKIGLSRFSTSVDFPESQEGETVDVGLRVEPAGIGYYIRGSASALVSVSCDICMEPCPCEVEADFEAWLSRDGGGVDECGPNEVQWPMEENSVDLTEVVAAALAERLPTEAQCTGGCSPAALARAGVGPQPEGGRAEGGASSGAAASRWGATPEAAAAKGPGLGAAAGAPQPGSSSALSDLASLKAKMEGRG